MLFYIAGVPARCFSLQTPMDVAHHLNMMRMNQTDGKVRRIPPVAYAMYKKHYEEPSTKEGFTEVKKIPFTVKFDSKRDEELFNQWTTFGH